MELTQQELQGKVRTLKRKVEENSAVVEKVVDSIVSKYNKDLDDYIRKIKRLLDRGDVLSDAEIENAVMRIPVFLYYAASGLESLGIEGDNAKAAKIEVFNAAYLEIEGTIQDKTKHAELQTFPEYLIEVAFARAYKKLKTQIDMAEHIFSGAKKVLSKRMLDIDISRQDPNRSTNRRSRLDDD